MELLEVQSQGQDQEPTQEQEARQGQASLLDVIDRALDKGLVIEGWRSVRLLGIEVLTLDIGAVVASCATYLALAEAIEGIADRSDTGDVESDIVPR